MALHDAHDQSEEAVATRERCQTLANSFLLSCAQSGIDESETVNAMVQAIAAVALNTQVLSWKDIVQMMRSAADVIELAKGTTTGGMH